MRLAALLLLPACLLGEDPFKGESNRPELSGEPELVEPTPTGGGPVPIRAGTEVVVRLRAAADLDPEATELSLGGDALDCSPEDPRTLLCRRTYDGTEVPTTKGVRGDLVNPLGNRTSLNTPPLILVDFTSPDATCLLSPQIANARDDVSLLVTLSKPIDPDSLQITPSDDRIIIVPQAPIGLQQPFAIFGAADTNIEDYVLTITAADLAGNPQQGASLCDEASRTGTILGRGPQLSEPVQITATESVVDGSTTWVRSGGEVRVTFPTVDPIDVGATRVALSGIELRHVQDQTWGIDLQGDEGDGLKDLNATLADAAGNALSVTEADALRFDFTPPSADCVLSPLFANAEQPIFLDVFASEPLPNPPAVSTGDPRLSVTHVSTTNTQHRYQLAPDPGQNIDYVLTVTATDRAGNPSGGDSMCDPANRTGEVRGVVPQLDGELTVEAEPHELIDGIPTVREGATLSVHIPTVSSISGTATRVNLSGLELTYAGDNTWTHTLTGDEGEGIKSLDARLVDNAGNTHREQRSEVIRFDFSPPSAWCSLSPAIANASQQIRFEVQPSEPLEGPPEIYLSDDRVQHTPLVQEAGGWVSTLSLIEPDNLAFTLTVDATDRVGNTGVDLCTPGSRDGQFIQLPPTLVSEGTSSPDLPLIPIEATPHVLVDDTMTVRQGAQIVVELLTVDPIDTDASNVTLSGVPLSWDGDGRWVRTLDGSEGDGLKNLDALLVDAVGNSSRFQRAAVLRFDFTPPAATCEIRPSQASAADPVQFTMTVSEPLAGPPTITSSGDVTLSEPTFDGQRWTVSVTAPPDANTHYTLDVQATDRVGNTAAGDDLCASGREGSVFGVMPQLAAPPEVTVSPEVTLGGVPAGAAGSTVYVSLTPVHPIDTAATTVSLAGLPMQYHPGEERWMLPLQGGEGDGPKLLDIRLRDAVGNTTPVLVPSAVTFDFTPPSAACLLSPNPANRTQAEAGLIFELRANEALAAAPTLSLSDPRVSHGTPSQPSALVWRYPLSVSGLPADFSFTLDATAADLLGNEAQGAALCPDADRTGTIEATPPTASDVQLTVTGARVHHPAEGEPIAGLDAEITVTLTSDDPIDTAATLVQLGDILLTHAGGLSWTHQVRAADLDGLKPLSVTLVSPIGNRAPLDTAGLGVRVDLTPPNASCQISPTPANASQLSGITLTLQPSEPLGEPPTLSVDAAGVIPGTPSFTAPRWTLPLSAAGVTSDVDYLATVTLTDRVGNTATGAEVCPAVDRTGRIRPVPPVVSTTPTLSFDGPPPFASGSQPWVRATAEVHVSFASSPSYDPAASSVTLSGTPLSWDATAARWTTGPLSGSEGDGLKALQITLTDAFGNTRSQSFPDVVGFDFTRPSASCVLSPAQANGSEAPQLQLFADEPLSAPPDLTIFGDVAVTLTDAASDARSFTWSVAATATGNNLEYGFQIHGTDRVGNPQRGTSFCAPADRNGSIDNRPPAATASFEVTPSVRPPGEPRRAAHGATLEVTLTADEPLGVVGTAVSLGDVSLDIANLNTAQGTTPETWVTTLQGSLDDAAHTEGLKQLVALYRDERGNPGAAITISDLPDARVIADFTAPEVVSVLLQRQPFFAPADPGSGTVRFTDTDPITGDPVRAVLTVFTNEALAVSATLHNTGPQTLPFTSSSSGGQRADFTLDSFSAVAEGSYTFGVELTDLVGNSAQRSLQPTTLIVDRTGPASAPSVDAGDAVVLDRAPWGTSSVGTSPAFAITGAAGSASPGAFVTAETSATARLASGFAEGDGAFSLTLGTDQAEVWLRQHDDAGNPSPASRVRDVQWTATLRGKVAGSDLENPHRLDEAPLLTSTFTTPTDEVADLPHTTVSAPTWMPWDAPEPSPAPPERVGHAMAYNPVTGVLLMFGGRSPDDTPLADTWAWDGERWAEVTPPPSVANQPTGRFDHAMAFDPANGRVLLQGGCVNPGSFGQCSQTIGETWEWDGTRWIARNLSPNPGSRDRHAMVFDAARQRIVLFGGRGGQSCGSTGPCSDTWEWDGTQWERRALYSPPARRSGHQLAFDVDRGEVVLFGGMANLEGSCGDPTSTRCRDTWLWDGDDWVEVTDDPATGPSPRTGHSMAYDPTQSAVVLVGGLCVEAGVDGSAQTTCADAWTWSGTQWTELPTPTGPLPRIGQAMAYDPAAGQLLIFGGQAPAPDDCAPASSPMCHDTWVGDGAAWTERPPLDAADIEPPGGLQAVAMAYDASRERVVLFGGRAPDNTLMDRTWEWDGTTWQDVSPSPKLASNTPLARADHAMVYDAARQEVVLFGGFGGAGGTCNPTVSSNRCADTWVWSGTTWMELTASAPDAANTPTGRHGHRLAYDLARERIVLFGGSGATTGACGSAGATCRDTWEWDGTTWLDRTPVSITPANTPSARFDHGMAGHDEAGQVVLFGGTTGGLNRESDTWVWNGTVWAQLSPPSHPTARRGHAMSYDPARERIVLFAGAATFNSTRFNDTWEWDGATWRERATDTAPPGRIDHALAPFPPSDEMVVYGGQTNIQGTCGVAGSTTCRDTWRLPSGSQAAPAHLFAASFVAALAPEAQLRTVTARWTAGGLATPEGSPTPGAELILWTGDQWTPLDAHAADPDDPAELCIHLTDAVGAPTAPRCTELVDPVLLSSLFRFGPTRTATFGVRPVEPIGFDEGVIHTDDLTVTVRYRLPPH